MTRPPLAPALLAVALLLPLAACGRIERERQAAADSARAATIAEIGQMFSVTSRRIDRAANAADRTLSPMPVMTPSEEEDLRRYLNATHVARARALGVRVANEEALDSLVLAGTLIQLEDSTAHWIVRPGDSPAHVTPDVRAMLQTLGQRFHERLLELDLPPYRIEVTSALRTSRRQARLRGGNPNAAAGVSSHEFGTTVDLSYAAFAPPADRPGDLLSDVPNDLQPTLAQLIDLSLESVSARKSRELGRIFSRVLAEAQEEGLALVIYERQQTVYHVTVGRRLVE